MISVNNVSMRYGSKILFEDVTVTFIAGRRYGLTGPNGAGKSTFMKVLTGEIDAQKGNVVRPKKLGVLRQDQYAFDAYRVIDTVIMGNKPLWAAMEERDRIYEKAELTDADGMRLGELEGIVGEEDGYTAESDAAILLQGLDIPDDVHERKMGELQGGQKVRVLLAQALFGKPQALLLDEPTNYLDLDSIHWLQDFLLRFEGTLITISHDRHFLNSVCTHIADIDYQTIITYTGGYDDMVVAKTQIRSRLESENAQREKKISQLNEFIARFAAGTRSSQVTSRKKEVERLQTNDLARSNIQRPYLRFEQLRPSGKHTLEFENVCKAYDGQSVIDGFSGSVMRGEKVCLMGRNGQGKTTLLKSLLAELPDLNEKGFSLDGGTVKWGHEAQIGYFPQDHTGAIEHGTTVFDWLYQFDPKATKEDIRGLLGQMLFSGEEGLKPTSALSGGEAARLLFCKLMLQKPNILILDEPTNHLDLESINALNLALQKYEGTVLLVTHDHDLIEEVGTRIWHFENGSIEDFKGPYEEYAAASAANR
ncbi:ABC-F family ATP-binding cassette domain-containing protein [Acidipila rosea]|uniref:Probable ATP-binding protein YbiT n=1 Tax=Acidipila rosea TaxID=768535 RepID=A0A4R1LBT7_9BACT|nr:ATP-binding cassette domain-containing protein [Acidipila rosea]MBW4025944.1 ATP-binding cassette domain-containing protein [Acidobacteriota bacterium]MBW4044137.1 ATP-binding cassette domain-containing protein [Acidobacteriota bacterium]TCK75832.1 ATPase subunit of ABC transporter with duplicated ATPase domains [Acidipila rosea]